MPGNQMAKDSSDKWQKTMVSTFKNWTVIKWFKGLLDTMATEHDSFVIWFLSGQILRPNLGQNTGRHV
jgi:hypothetical protein